MAEERSYLDYNASAPLLPAAREAMRAALELNANPSSVHAEGREARGVIETARRNVASLVNARPEHVIFTSGATEAAATLLSPDWTMGRAPLRVSKLYVAASDHPCLLSGGRFAVGDIRKIGVDKNGILDLEELKAALANHDRSAGLPLVAVHVANNETGVIQPMREIGALVKEAGGIAVFDAVQAAGRIPLDITEGYADFLILSSHKIGGPKGAGAIVGASDLMMPRPLIGGGGQEKGHRAGTENTAAIAGFGAAAAEASAALEEAGGIAEMRDRIEETVISLVPDAVFFGRDAPRIANTAFFAIPGVKAETAQIAFDLGGVAVSAGSACSSGKVGPSHVLKAMGVGEDVGALRVSIGPATDEDDVERFRAALAGIARRRRSNAEAA